MLEEKPLTVDFTKKDAILEVLPRAPLLSSSQVGWNSIYLEHHCQSGDEMLKHCHTQHVVMIHHLQRPLKAEQMIDGCFQSGCLVNGEILVVPAQVQHRSCWAREVKYTLLTLEPSFVTRTAYELIEPERVEIVPYFPKPDPLIYQIGLALKAELETDGIGSRLYAESMATALSAHLLRYYSARHCISWGDTGGLPKSKLKQVIDYISEHLNQDLGLAELAELVQMSSYYFARLFKQSTGLTPHQYVIHCRVERAKQLLLKGELKIAEVAYSVGFAHQSHLNHHFKRLVGVTPKVFVKR